MATTATIRLLVLAIIVLTLAGCGYQLTNATHQRQSIGQTVWVPFIANESVSPTAQTVVRRALYDEYHALRGLLPAESEAAADLRITGRLVSYSSKAVSYSALDRAKGFSLLLDVELAAYRKGAAVPLWKGTLQASQDYPANSDLALQRNAEERALEAAARKIAQKLISATEQSY